MISLVIVSVMVLTPGSSEALAFSSSDITLSSRTIGQGQLCLIRIRVEEGEVPHVLWRKKEVYLVPNGAKTLWYGFLSADLEARKGDFEVAVTVGPPDEKTDIWERITKKFYGVRRLTLPKKMVDLDPKTLERVEREARAMRKLWEASPSAPLWRGPFIRPVPGVVVGPFGRDSIINNEPRAPHSGVDFRAARGTPVKATNNGRVVLTGDLFFTGDTVVIDHGGGIQSMYFHLERILVKKGEEVSTGQVIGEVGSTGRATGPHLHWGIRVNGDRVDPLRLVTLSKELE